MKANVYTGFLTNKVKVYSTEKGAKPQEASGRTLRRGLPMVLASIMMAMPAACNPVVEKTDSGKTYHVETLPAVNDVLGVKIYEFLSEAAINGILANPAPAPLEDVNFNHMPENQANFWEIVRNGVAKTNELQNSSRLNDDQKSEYRITARKMLAQIKHAKGDMQNVDLRDYNNLKTFLYFEKVVRYGDKYWKVLGRTEGTIDERAEAFGRYYQDQEMLKMRMANNVGMQKFAKALYACNERFVLNYNDSIQANAMSREILKDWLTNQKVKDSNLWYYAETDEYDYANVLAVYNSRGNPVRAVLGVSPKGDLGDGFYSPVGSVIIHELQHLMQKKPASKEKPEDNQKEDGEIRRQSSHFDDFAMELGPTLYSLTIEDRMYKKLHGINEDKIMDYGHINFGTHHVSLGQTAVWFGKMLEKYPHSSVDKVLCEDEVVNHLNALGNNTKPLILNNANGR